MLRMALDFSVLMCQAPKTCTRKCISEILLAFFLCAHPPFETVSVIAHICNRTLRSSRICSERSSVFVFFVIYLRFTSLHIITYVTVEFCDEQSLEQTAVTMLNMHERCTPCSGCIGVNDFLLSHYHKLWFIGIVARRQRDMITQSSGT